MKRTLVLSKMHFFKKYLFIIIPISGFLILSINMNKPFIGHHDFMSAFEGMQARNYLEYGFLKLKFGAIPGHIKGTIEDQQAYTLSYLPLLSVLISISFHFFGITEWSERLIPIIFSSLGVFTFYLIIKKLWNQKIAFMASLFYMLNPMFIYFGKLPAPDIPILAMILVSFYFYIIWIEDRKKIAFILSNVTLFIGGLFGWTIIYFGPLIIIHSVIIKKFKMVLIIPIIVSVLTIALQFLHSYVLTGSFLTQNTLSLIKFRLAQKDFSFGGTQFSLVSYIKQEISWLQAYFTRIMLTLSAIGVFSNFYSRVNIQFASLVFFLGLGVSHPILFSRYVFVHDFLNIYLLPFFSISAALGLKVISKYLHSRRISDFISFMLILIILAIFLIEKLNFTMALIRTDMNIQGMNMAGILNNLQEKDNETVIVSPRFDNFYGIFTNFYTKYSFTVQSDMSLEHTLDKNQKRYKYLIFIDEDITNKKFYENLIEEKISKKVGNLTIVFNK